MAPRAAKALLRSRRGWPWEEKEEREEREERREGETRSELAKYACNNCSLH